jgi:RNA polymerase sigma factor (sigma-70 family)
MLNWLLADKLYRENLNHVLRVILKQTDPATAEDITHDAFLTAFNKYDQLKNPNSFRAWVIVIAVNKCKLYYRNCREIPTSPLSISAICLADSDQTLDGILDRDLIEKATQMLSPADRALVFMKYELDMETQDICNSFGITVETYRVRLSRARKRLRKIITELNPVA